MNYKDVDQLVRGSELKKVVWGMFKKRKNVKVSEITAKYGYHSSNVSTAIKFLVDNKIVEKSMCGEKIIHGTYVVCDTVEKH